LTSDRIVHTVESGDTLFGLARRYGTTVPAILELNGTTSTSIRIGQRLRVR
jgi:LysM repeat protein